MSNRELDAAGVMLCKQLKLSPDWFCLYEAVIAQNGEIVFAFYAYKQSMYKFIGGHVFNVGPVARWVQFARQNGTVSYDDYPPPFCREIAIV